MKTKNNLIKITLSILLIGFMFTSCSKDDDDEKNETTTTNAIKMKVDNNAEIVYKDNFSAMVVVDKLIIGAADNTSGGDIQFSLDPDIATGTYTTGFLISHGVNGQAVFSTLSNSSSHTLTISIHNTADKHIKGEFSINFIDNNTGADRHAEGSFDVIYL